MDTWLRCKVANGQFSGEFAVTAQSASGASFSLFVPAADVEVDAIPGEGQTVDGWIRVEKIDEKGDLLLVQLPGLTFDNGRTVTVNKAQVKKRRSKQEA
jgi:hypothetical protein